MLIATIYLIDGRHLFILCNLCCLVPDMTVVRYETLYNSPDIIYRFCPVYCHSKQSNNVTFYQYNNQKNES